MPLPTRPRLASFLKTMQAQSTDIASAVPTLICAIAQAAKKISDQIRNIGVLAVTGAEGTCNVSGDVQQKLDLIAHRHCIAALQDTQQVCALVSEEAEDMVVMDSMHDGYIVTIDPLDGSSNIDVNAPLGTIFGLYKHSARPTSGAIQLTDVLQIGSKQLAAGYVLYGTQTTLVCTMGSGVHGFIYDASADDFLLAYPTLQMPQQGNYYAVNDGYYYDFPPYVQRYIESCRQRHYKSRYTGALVADFHRHLLQGGIYLYPPTHTHPAGRLRLVVECNALAFVAAQAGGMASSGQQPTLSIAPSTIHQRVPFFVGSTHMVQELLLSS